MIMRRIGSSFGMVRAHLYETQKTNEKEGASADDENTSSADQANNDECQEQQE